MENEENNYLDIADDIGRITMIEQVIPGVYYVSVLDKDTSLPREYYIAEKSCSVLSDEAKSYGQALEHHTEYLCYPADNLQGSRMVLEYEVNRFLAINGLPLMNGERLLSIPVPLDTPRGTTLRYIALTNGVFIIETDRLERVLAVCFPIWICEISDYTRRQAEQNKFDAENGIENTEGYLFFPEQSACLALFELWNFNKQISQSGRINAPAMMNAIWKYHPMYAATHNVKEQVGMNDSFGMLMVSLGFNVELKGGTENIIPFSEEVGTDYMFL